MTGLSVLGVIVARGGSKGVPGKNLLPLAGKPLVVHTIEAALACSALTRTVLSTEDPGILAAGRQAGCPAPFVRPAELAGDRSSTVDVALHAVDWLARHEGFAADVVVLLPATAPLRTAGHIAGAVEALRGDPGAEGVVAVTEPDYPPFWMLTAADNRLRWLSANGATTRVVPSPTPPVECLSTVGPERRDRSSRSPDSTIAWVSATASSREKPLR